MEATRRLEAEPELRKYIPRVEHDYVTCLLDLFGSIDAVNTRGFDSTTDQFLVNAVNLAQTGSDGEGGFEFTCHESGCTYQCIAGLNLDSTVEVFESTGEEACAAGTDEARIGYLAVTGVTVTFSDEN